MRRGLFSLLAGMLLLGGCGGGETVPLVSPGGNCDFAPDPLWQQQTGILEGERVQAVAWPAGGRPVVVGTNGAIAVNETPGRWRRESSGVQANLSIVVGDGAGGLLAAGGSGATIRRPPEGWQAVAGLPENGWYDLVHGDGAYWLAGNLGVLARVDSAGQATVVPVPTDATLRAVLAENDSLFVMGEAGFCQVRVGGVWSALDFPIPEDGAAERLFRLSDGRLLLVEEAGGGSIHVRETTGWVLHPEVNPDRRSTTFWYEDGYLWALSDALRRWDVSTDPWTAMEYPGFPYLYSDLGFGPDGAVFQNLDGSFQWHAVAGDGSLEMTLDPAGDLTFNSLCRLQDGTVVAPAEGRIYEIRPSGPRLVLTLDTVDAFTSLAGVSLQDFFFKNDGLFHHEEGQAPLEIPLPVEMETYRNMAANDAGQVLLTGSEGVCAWDGARWFCLPLEDYYNGQAHVTRRQTLVAMGSNMAIYLRPEGLISFPLDINGIGVSEPEPGLLMVHSNQFERCLYRMGTGALQVLESDPLPNCSNPRGDYFLETATGGLVVTRRNDLVLGVTISGTRAEWELVAGPWRDQIEYLQVLADGSLAALDRSSGRLLIHPAPGN